MEYSQVFNTNVIVRGFTEHISDPRSFVLFAYGNDGVALAYQQSTNRYIQVHLTENIFGWGGVSEYKADLVVKEDFLLCAGFVVAHITGICTGFTIPYSDSITEIIRPSPEVLVVVYGNKYHVYHINGSSYMEADDVFFINNMTFLRADGFYICVDDMFTELHDVEFDELSTYPYRHPKLPHNEINAPLRRFIDQHGFS